MKIKGKIEVSVDVDPLEVIDNLIKTIVPDGHWVQRVPGESTMEVYENLGSHRPDRLICTLPKEVVEYLDALKVVKANLRSREDKKCNV